jgi:hypothetical protein
MSTEMTALIAAIVLGGLFAFGFVGGETNRFAGHMFDPAYNNFTAKFIKP